MSDDTVTNIVGPGEPGGIVYTIKGGDGFSAPWIVARGSTAAEVAAQVADLVGMDASAFESPFEFLVAADKHVKAVLAAADIGAPVQKTYGNGGGQRGPAKSQGFAAKGGGQAASEPAKDAEPKHEFQEYLDLIADATSRADINALFARSKREESAAFKNEDVLAAAKAKTESFA